LRCIPGLTVIRPSDATETKEAWRYAIKTTDRPVALILSRQNLPVIDRKKFGSAEGLSKGAYIVADTDGTPDVIIIATGSEVHISLKAKDMLLEKGIRARVVSMPSMELFNENPQDYRDKVVPPAVKNRVIVEAGISMGWEKFAGERGVIIGIDTFGASAPGGTVMKKFGFTAENIVEKAMGLIGKLIVSSQNLSLSGWKLNNNFPIKDRIDSYYLNIILYLIIFMGTIK
jgi:transketolase